MVGQDKSHLHGRHVSENPLTLTAASSPDTLSLPGNLFRGKEERKWNIKTHLKTQPTLLLLFFFSINCKPPPFFTVDAVHAARRLCISVMDMG